MKALTTLSGAVHCLSSTAMMLWSCCDHTVIITFLLHVPLDDSGSSNPACLSVLTLVWRALLSVTCFALHNLFARQ